MMVERESSGGQNRFKTISGSIRKWIFRLAGIILALGAMVWANESTLRTAHIMNSVLVALVVLLIFTTEIMLVRETNASLNPITFLINGIVIVIPLMNIAVFSAPLAGLVIVIGIVIAVFLLRSRSILLMGKNNR